MLKGYVRHFMLALTLVLVACGGATERKAAYISKGQDLYKAGNYEKARLEFKNALQIDPKDVEARVFLAETLEKLQNLGEAAGNYLAVLQLAPKHQQALARMGRIYLLNQKIDEAKKLADRLIEANPQSANGLALEAAIKIFNKDFSGGIGDAKAALAVQPNHEDATLLLAATYFKQEKPESSIETLKLAIKNAPSDMNFQMFLAQLYVQLGKKQEAIDLLTQIIQHDATTLSHRLRLAQFYLADKRIDEAEAVLRKAILEITADPKDATKAKLALVEFQAKFKTPDVSIKTLKAMVEAEPSNRELEFVLARLYEATNELDAARSVYQAIIDLEEDKKGPAALTAKTHLAATSVRTGNKAEARKLAEEVLKENPRDREALLLRGNLFLADKNGAAAISDFRAALKDDPSSPEINRILADAHLSNNEPELAIDTLQKAISLNSIDTVMRGDLANIYASQNKLDDAIRALEEIIKLAPVMSSPYEGVFRIRMSQEDWNKAHEIAGRLKAAAGNDPTGFFLDGVAYQAENKLAESTTQFEAALAVSPDAVQPLGQLVKSLVAMGQKDVAEKRLVQVLQKNSKNFVASNLRGELQLSGKHFADAEKSFEAAIAGNPGWPVPYRNLAATQLGMGKEARALKTLEEGIEVTKGSALLVTTLAGYFEKAGKLDLAMDQYEAVLKANPQSDLAKNNLAVLLAEYKTDPKSLQRAKDLTAAFSEPVNPMFLDTIGWVAYRNGDFHAALQSLEKAVKGAADAPIVRYHLGMTYLQNGNTVLAKDNLKQAVDSAQEYHGSVDAKAALTKLEARQ